MSDLASNRAFEDGIQTWWDAHSLGNFKRCPRYYQYTIREGYTTRRAALTLVFGLIFHEAMECAARMRAAGDDLTTILRAAFRLVHLRVRDNSEPFLDAPIERQPLSLLRAVVWFLDEHQGDDTLEINGKPAVELAFKFPLNSRIMLCGYLDRLINFAGGVYVEDYKTTKSAVTSRYFENYSPDTQVSMYSVAGRIILAQPVAGVLITGIQLGGTFSRSSRGLISRTPAQLDEWLKETEEWIGLADYYAKRASWPQNDKVCGLYGGCMFRSICSRDPSVREAFLQGDFVRSSWDPTKERT